MRRHRPAISLKPYEPIPDGREVPQPKAPLSWRLAYLGFGVLIVVLIAMGAIL